MICENCGKEHDGSFGSGRFCCKKCAHTFSTKNDNSKELKDAKCIECGKIIYINKRASDKKCLCNDCKKQYLLNNHPYYCKICGKPYLKGKGGCNNNFCKTHNIQGFNLLINFGFDKNKLGTPEVEKEYNRIRDIIYNLYWNENLTGFQISQKYNFKSKHSILQTVFKFLNIPIRNLKQAGKLAYLEGRMPIQELKNQYKTGWHTTWNNKKVYFRSSYELDYAKELDSQKINYEVENLRIKYFDTNINEYCTAIPDFYLPDTNTIVEIKSTWTLDIQEMKDKVKSYKELGYNFKLILEHKEENLYSLQEEKIHQKRKEFSIYRIMGSSWGTCWIHNDIENKKIKKEQLNEYISNGWIKGRKMIFRTVGQQV